MKRRVLNFNSSKLADLRFSVDSGGGASDNLSGLGELLTVDSGEVVTFPAVYQHIEDIPFLPRFGRRWVTTLGA